MTSNSSLYTQEQKLIETKTLIISYITLDKEKVIVAMYLEKTAKI